jgi:hypothetical protein
MGAPAGGCSPGPKLPNDLEHRQFGVEEDDVDRKAHERRMHRPCRSDQHALAVRQLLAPEQAAPTVKKTVGDLAELADDLTFRADKNDRVHRFEEAIECAASIATGYAHGIYQSGGPTTRRSARLGDWKRPDLRVSMGFGNASAIGLYEIHGKNCFMLDRFDLRVVDLLIAREQDLKKKSREAVGGYLGGSRLVLQFRSTIDKKGTSC